MRLSLLQMRSGTDVRVNLEVVAAAAAEAADLGARILITPEGTNLLQRDSSQLAKALEDGRTESALAMCADIARRERIWLVAGSLIVRGTDGKAANRSHVFSPEGALVSAYDKIHLFDVTLSATEQYRESATFSPGDQAQIVEIEGIKLGLSICYDLRFAGLYRHLAQQGADVIVVPAAFTKPTGAAHWEVLLRARAIETGGYILAPAQGGKHEDGRETWGRTMAVGPWGEIVGRFEHDEPGLLTLDIDPAAVNAARTRIPQLSHDRTFAPASLSGQRA